MLGLSYGSYRKSSNKTPGGLLNLGRGRGGAYLQFLDRQRQNYTMSMEFEMLRSFNNNNELLRYITNTIKNRKQKYNLFLAQYAFCFNALRLFYGGRGEGGGLLERRGLLKLSTSRRGLLRKGGLIREGGLINEGVLSERRGLLERGAY